MGIGQTIFQLFQYAFTAYYIAIFYYVIMSWVPALGENAVGEFVHKIVNPYVEVFRKIIPPLGMIDISVIFALIAFRFIQMLALNGLATVLSTLGI
ncbi:YggT family protein [Alkalicoccus luteus]|uniref:YggT family protein n=1 Tax=Alkalicoccus luteus TaxID=1237094 RepID=A0A969TUZ0_9BACI|nr:YggT family protein [Alkalicoccus luteus]NJP37567.1 YggT family protein [Alkalicoccus luteus]